MTETTDGFEEHVHTKADKDFIADSCTVFADAGGRWITIETCPYEGSAMVTLPCAIKVHRALGRAIRAAKAARKGNV